MLSPLPRAGSPASIPACLRALPPLWLLTCLGVLGNKQPRVCTTAGEQRGLPLALQTCPSPPQQLLLAQQRRFTDPATAWLERQGWLWGVWGGCTGVPISPRNPKWGAWGGEREWVLPAPSPSISIPQHGPHHPCDVPTVPLYVRMGVCWGGFQPPSFPQHRSLPAFGTATP